MERKLVNRLQCWQGKLFSLPGRITLTKHCLTSIPLHAMAVFRLPVDTLNRFDRIIRNFIWDGDRPSDHLARWDIVVFSRLLRGAGVTNLSRACESSLYSWWWRLATEHSPIILFLGSKFDRSSPTCLFAGAVFGGCGSFQLGGAFGKSTTTGSSGTHSLHWGLWLVLCREMFILPFSCGGVLFLRSAAG
ncbi:putative ribonuclease H protein [Nymphaea thermarum]|nr:putative ribonuclease H protein [Nymphaea thermarum]